MDFPFLLNKLDFDQSRDMVSLGFKGLNGNLIKSALKDPEGDCRDAFDQCGEIR
jgi:hypothetical protein